MLATSSPGFTPVTSRPRCFRVRRSSSTGRVSPVSLRTVLFTDRNDSSLIVVVGGHEPDTDVELALPYGLEHVGDRDLVLVVPVGTEWPMLARLPWLDHHTRVFTHADGVVTEHTIPLRSDIHVELAASPAAASYEVSADHLGWADEVITWGQPSSTADRQS